MRHSSPEDWTRYLRNHTLTSFGRIFPDNYDGEFLEFWHGQFASPGRLEHLIDMCCGNGALSWIANEFLNGAGPRVQVTGVDFADIDPFRALQRDPAEYPGIRFVGNTGAENLPFATASIDLIVSQYGIEYTDLRTSIPELARVLRPGGRMAFIMHDTESEVVRGSTQRLGDMQTVLGLGIHELALRLFDLGLELRTPAQRQGSQEYRALIDRLNTLTGQVRGIVSDYDRKSPIHRYMNRVMAVFGDPETSLNPGNRQYLAEAAEPLQAHISKIEHLQAAALTPQALSELVAIVGAAGFTVIQQGTFLYARDIRVGTALVAERIDGFGDNR